ncbi:MAG TPA: TadE family protein [Candidatus Limnocylindrales bacterium]|nr:TadE family protein [Candidatus Limnocylindrales bacterium]
MRRFTASRAASGPAHRSRGQALAEFAIVFPVFILLVVAAIDLGRGAFTYNSVTNAAREGARLAIVNQDVAAITQRTTNQTWMAEIDAPNVSVEFYEPTPNADPTQNDECDPVGYGCVAVVSFETTFRPITPIIQNILFPSGVTLSATSVEVVEFTCPTATITAANCPKQP